MSPWIGIGALSAGLAVAVGAFGAHGLRAKVGPELLVTFETGARYHFYHSLGLIVLGLAAGGRHGGLWTAAGIALLAGIALFSGSLYALVLTGARGLGAITPLGGLAFLLGWALFAAAALRQGS
jgi:uncharacterized membrane protein YgdD (TMEM256/DUF423 family)